MNEEQWALTIFPSYKSERCGYGSVDKALDFHWFREVEGLNPARVIFVSGPQRMGVG